LDFFRTTLDRGSRKILKKLNLYSDYDRVIPPEIAGDAFFTAIRALSRTADVHTVLEIGSSAGNGSTLAFVEGIHENPNRPILFCVEMSVPRFEQLQRRYAGDAQVKCYNASSVSLDSYPAESDVIEFYRTRTSNLNRVPLEEVLRWRTQDISYITRNGSPAEGIRLIKQENGITHFGMVLIDGSEFTGAAELEEVYGARYILLDDIGTYKNMANYDRLGADSAYRLIEGNTELRNGYAIFERIPT
jgi:hypothetical protein